MNERDESILVAITQFDADWYDTMSPEQQCEWNDLFSLIRAELEARNYDLDPWDPTIGADGFEPFDEEKHS